MEFKSRDESKAIFIWEERRGRRELEKGVIDLGLSINKKIIKERVGQDTKIADFVLHLQLRKCK